MMFVSIVMLVTACGEAAPPSTPEVLADTFFFGHAYIDDNQNGQIDADDPPLADAQFTFTTKDNAVTFGDTTATDGSAMVVVPGGLEEANWPISLRIEAPQNSAYTLIGPSEINLTYPQTSADVLFSR